MHLAMQLFFIKRFVYLLCDELYATNFQVHEKNVLKLLKIQEVKYHLYNQQWNMC